MTNPRLTLYQFAFSHFNEKVRWALDLKQLTSVRKNLLPGFHTKTTTKLSGTSQVPILVCDGVAVTDSSEILRALDRIAPTPALFPQDASVRREVDDWLVWLDDEVGPDTRLGIFHRLLEDEAYFAALFATGQPIWKRIPYRRMFPRMLPILRKRMNLSDEAAAAANERTTKALARIATAAGPTGYLVGDRFTAADLTAAALLFPLSFPSQLRFSPPDLPSVVVEDWKQRWAGEPGVHWMQEIFRKHR